MATFGMTKIAACFGIAAVTLCAAGTAMAELPVRNLDIAQGGDDFTADDSNLQLRWSATGLIPDDQWEGNDDLIFQANPQFDNSGSFKNARGNLLMLNFGAPSAGPGRLYNLSTDGSMDDNINSNGQLIFSYGPPSTPDTDPDNSPNPAGYTVPSARMTSISVSPDNNYVAAMGWTNGRLYILRYDAGPTPGTGNGASITGAWDFANPLASITTGDTCATTWLDNDTVLVYASIIGQGRMYIVDVAFNDNSTPADLTDDIVTTTWNEVIPLDGATPRRPDRPQAIQFLGASYTPDPVLNPNNYIFLHYTDFSSSNFCSLFVIQPPAGFNPAGTWEYVQTGGSNGWFLDTGNNVTTAAGLPGPREIFMGIDGYLYTNTFSTDFYRIDVDSQSPQGVIDAADIAALGQNATDTGPGTVFFEFILNSPNFDDFATSDAAYTSSDPLTGTPDVTEACCLGAVCVQWTVADCTAEGGTPAGPGTFCAQVDCGDPQGACCLSDGTCTELTEADCNAIAGAVYGGDLTTCTNRYCPDFGACCLPDDSCVSVRANECTDLGGTYRGDFTTCAATVCADLPNTCITTYDFDSNVVGTPAENLSFSVSPSLIFPAQFPSSAFDVFGVTDRTVNGDFADDSLGGDTYGLLRSTQTSRVFGVEDLENNDFSGTGTAEWTFDISGFENVAVEIEFAAIGNFESSNDTYTFTASIDAGAPVTIFEALILDNPQGDILPIYTLESGFVTSEDFFGDLLTDPVSMTFNNAADAAIVLNQFVRLQSQTLGSGSTLTLSFSTTNNGGGEVFLFDNICVKGDPIIADPTGACCVGTVCTIETAADCATAGGSYQGDTTTCTPDPCAPPATGACCTNGLCTIATAADCASGGGTYQGDNVACDSDALGQLPGTVCCPADFNGDGTNAVGDILDFLAAYSAQDVRGDFNRDGVWAVGDILDFLAAYALGCPTP